MAGMRYMQRLHLLELVVPLGGIALWMCAGCAAKKADLPPPTPQVQPQATGSALPPSVPGQTPASRGGAPEGRPASGRGVGMDPADLRAGPMLVHKVRFPGESLSIIAGWYTGKIENWKILADVNPGINPNVIVKGIKINLPESMLIKREPMTREYVDSFNPKSKSKSKSKKAGSRGKSSTPDDEETPLFGPKH